jgi:hypothetical protein
MEKLKCNNNRYLYFALKLTVHLQAILGWTLPARFTGGHLTKNFKNISNENIKNWEL